MKIKNFFETNDNFTEEEIDIILSLLDIVSSSLQDYVDYILSRFDTCNISDLNTVIKDFDKVEETRKTFNKFYFALDKYNDNKKWGKYL